MTKKTVLVTGSGGFIVLFRACELFDPGSPDTFFCEV